jgi:hypothetical protein
MSIPLDRLYHFLDSISNHALLIYGWRPHGSKKLQDLVAWTTLPTDWRIRKTQPVLIFHDQEPLDYDFSQLCVDQNLCDVIKDWGESIMMSNPVSENFLKKLHLKSVTDISFYDYTLLVHSEKNSNQLLKFEQNNFVPVYYWSHAIIARDWFRFAEHDLNLRSKCSEPSTFLIYNRAWSGTREYRLKFTELLVNTGLYRDCITSFAALDNNIHYTNHVFKNNKFKTSTSELENIMPINLHSPASSADYNSVDYQNSQIEIVLETIFDDSRIHLTEKTLRPIACGQPFIVASAPGSLQYLRDYGFKTFDGLINEVYDTICNPVDRLESIITEMQRISALPTQQKNHLVKKLQEIADYNQQLFFSEKFHTQLLDEFRSNLNSAVSKVNSGPVGNTWKQFESIIKCYHPDQYCSLSHQIPEDIKWAHSWIESHTKS